MVGEASGQAQVIGHGHVHIQGFAEVARIWGHGYWAILKNKGQGRGMRAVYLGSEWAPKDATQRKHGVNRPQKPGGHIKPFKVKIFLDAAVRGKRDNVIVIVDKPLAAY